ncbi:MAG: hypothetical protein JWP80_5115, partial [Pseudomonas sp.]|nr:hypothetical protein [Pseudomonas sp.]
AEGCDKARRGFMHFKILRPIVIDRYRRGG